VEAEAKMSKLGSGGGGDPSPNSTSEGMEGGSLEFLERRLAEKVDRVDFDEKVSGLMRRVNDMIKANHDPHSQLFEGRKSRRGNRGKSQKQQQQQSRKSSSTANLAIPPWTREEDLEPTLNPNRHHVGSTPHLGGGFNLYNVNFEEGALLDSTSASSSPNLTQDVRHSLIEFISFSCRGMTRQQVRWTG